MKRVETQGRQLDHYDHQIAALRKGVEAERRGDREGAEQALREYCEAAVFSGGATNSTINRYEARGETLLVVAWDESVSSDRALFSILPDDSCCLTQAKAFRYPIADTLGLMTNDLIPVSPKDITVEMLPEFARLQRLAREGKGVVAS